MIYFKRFLFFVMPVAATVDLMVSRTGPRWSNSNSNGRIGPMLDTIKSTVAATDRIPELETDHGPFMKKKKNSPFN